MDSRHEVVKVNSCHLAANSRVDTLAKMKATLPSFEKYTSQSSSDETFSDFYYWIFTYHREGGMRKVVDIDVTIHTDISNNRPPFLSYKSSFKIEKTDIFTHFSSF